MAELNSTVLVVGVAGRFAALVVPELVARGVRVRALVQTEADGAVARQRGATEIAIGDLRDASSVATAVTGVAGVFHIGPAFVADEAELGVRMVELASRAGARKFVFSGVNHPTNGLANHTSKQPVEQALYTSDLRYTILQPATLYQNIAGAWPGVVEHGVFVEPFSRKATVSRVDYRDVAEVAAIALTEDRLDYGTFELFSDGSPNREDIAAVMSEVLGRPIEAGEVSFEDWVAANRLPYDEAQLAMFAKVYAHNDKHGSTGNSLVLRAILGRTPRTLRDYLTDLAAGRA
jgi:uncharacterized protein YbjT (DUF2867 family)